MISGQVHAEQERAMTTGNRTVHPGEVLANELAELDLSARTFARLIKVPTNRVTQIVEGKRAITPDTALRLGRFFGTTAMYWINLQGRYDLVQAHKDLKHDLRKMPSVKGIRYARPEA
jgi:addiction module HigA family antidote